MDGCMMDGYYGRVDFYLQLIDLFPPNRGVDFYLPISSRQIKAILLTLPSTPTTTKLPPPDSL